MVGLLKNNPLQSNVTITAVFYVQQVQRMQFHEKRPALVNRKNVTFFHDNARPHTARVNQEKMIKLAWSVLPHPPYSLD